jgi:hypothetical protein
MPLRTEDFESKISLAQKEHNFNTLIMQDIFSAILEIFGKI